ncbi:hypothetical protein ACLB2K_006925 [Fragaria x ananassa]
MVRKPTKIYVSYEGIFEICFECGSHKHKIWDCPKKKKEKHFVMIDRALELKAPKKKKSAMVKPGISFRDMAARNGAEVIPDADVKKGLKLAGSSSPSSEKEEVVSLRKKVLSGKDVNMDDVLADGSELNEGNSPLIAISGSSEMSTGTGSRKRNRIIDDDNLEYEYEEEGSASTAKSLKNESHDFVKK